MCECRSARSHEPDDYRVISYDSYTAEGRQVVTVFPREPSWWNDDDDDSIERRQDVFRSFRQTDLVIVIDETWPYIQSPPQSVSEAASLLRRYWSLTWLAEVCVGSLPYVEEGDTETYFIRYWQQRAARYLASAAWQVFISLPSSTTQEGLALAAHSNEDVHQSEE